MKYLALILILTFALQSFSQMKVNRAKEILNQKTEVCVIINENDIQNKEFFKDEYIVDKVIDEQVYVYLSKLNFETFIQDYPNFKVFEPETKAAKANLMAHTIEELTSNWDRYPTYETYTAIMEKFETDYPELCYLESIGQSIEGRELWVVKISDNVDSDEIEPEFFYTSTMHGDETTGFVLMIRFIDYLLANYGTDNYVKELVDNIEIFINPLANPDGTYASGNDTVCYYCSSRSNANGIDLNRDYTHPGDEEDPSIWEQETEIMIDYMKSHSMVMSMNFHGGIELINYPWDYTVTRHADDAWFQLISREYADSAQFYSPSGYLTDLNNGITNGYDWYYAGGTRQDYFNYYLHGREVTAEISSSKAPASSEMPDFWEYNYRSFLSYMKQVTYGVHGIVSDAITGEPIRAFISIDDHDKDSSQVYSSADNGDYHRFLKAGTYFMRFTAEGYNQVSSTIIIDDYEKINFDVEMTSTSYENFAPVIVNDEGESIDTVNITEFKDSSLIYSFSVVDENNDPVSMISFESITSNAIIEKVNDTAIQVIPNEGFVGVEWVKVVVADTFTPPAKDSLYLEIEFIQKVNHAPKIVNSLGQSIDSLFLTSYKDSVFSFEINVTDIDDDIVSITSFESISDVGSISQVEDFEFQYTPVDGYLGKDLFKIKVQDDGEPILYDSVVVSIELVNYGDNPPVILDENELEADSLFYYTFQDSTIEICLNVEDLDEDNLAISNWQSVLNNGTIEYSSESLCFNYTPEETFIGKDKFLIWVCDDSEYELCDSVYIVVDVKEKGNNVPVIVNNEGIEVDTIFIVHDSFENLVVSVNVLDIDNDPVSICSAVSINDIGSISNISNEDTSFVYEPKSEYFGNDTLKIIVCDNSYYDLKDSVIYVISVNPEINHPPIITDELGNAIDSLTIGIYTDSIGYICIHATDPDQDFISITGFEYITENGTLQTTTNPLCFTYQSILGFAGNDYYKVIVCDDNENPLCDTLSVRTIVDEYVAIDEFNNQEISIYPNPFYEEINFVIDINDINSGRLDIYNISGIRVYTEEINDKNIKINTQALEEGLYFIVLSISDKYYKYKMLKQF